MLMIAALCLAEDSAAQAAGYDYPTVTQNIPAFPTAEGFGKFATGGRGGKVVTVTTLEDDAANPPVGSLRWALSQYPDEPVTVVFNVSGWIILKDVLTTKRTAGLTVAGQTAPGEGVTLYPRMFSINGAKNVVVRNMRFRTGSHAWDGSDLIKDAAIVDQALCAENTENVIFDHCTFGWSAEEIVNNQCTHFNTFQYCLLHEGLYDAGHHKGSARSFGCQWGGSQSTFHHNMLAHNYSRSPRFQGARDQDFVVYDEFVNNVNYNWGKVNACYGGENNGVSPRYNGHQVNFINNYWKPGPATKAGNPSGSHLFMRPTAGTKVSEWYLSGNVMEGDDALTADNLKGVSVDGDATKVEFASGFITPSKFYPGYKFDLSAYTMKDRMESAENAYRTVLDKVGCIVRDSIERRIIRECRDGAATFGGSWKNSAKYGIIDDQTDAEMVKQESGFSVFPFAEESKKRPDGWDTDGDGMPDEWENANGFDPHDPDDGNYINAEGYTALEKYLCSLMGEEIGGNFGETSSVRSVNAVRFGLRIEGNTIYITGDNICGLHVFDDAGRCRMAGKLKDGDNTADVSFLPEGVYIAWVTDCNGYRNARKFLISK